MIIWLTVPLALIGIVFGLIATQTLMMFVSILAVLSLTGMLIRNSIVLIDETDHQISDGKARFDAVVDAAVSRVRPVTLGVLTTVLGVIPLLWDPFFQGLAVVIITGLIFATVLPSWSFPFSTPSFLTYVWTSRHEFRTAPKERRWN